MFATIRHHLRFFKAQDETVHFHQGPQGQPAPCFDNSCRNPRLSL
jgi:hypothetical protein